MVNVLEMIKTAKIKNSFVYFDGECYHVKYKVELWDNQIKQLKQSLGIAEENLITSTHLDFCYSGDEIKNTDTIFRVMFEKISHDDLGEVFISYYRCLDIRTEETQTSGIQWKIMETFGSSAEETLRLKKEVAKRNYELYCENGTQRLIDVYDISYDEQDEYGVEHLRQHQNYHGNYQDLQQKLEQMKQEGKYNFTTQLLYSEDEPPQQQESPATKINHL